MSEDDYSYLYRKYNEYKSRFANGEFKPVRGGEIGYATNLRFLRRDRYLEKLAKYYAQQCSNNVYFYETCDVRFLTQKRSVVTFVKEPFMTNKDVVDKMIDSIKGMVEGKNNSADSLHTNCRLSYGFGDMDLAYVGCGLATGEVKYFPEFQGYTYLYTISCIYAPLIPKNKCYDWSTDKGQVCGNCPPDARPCRKSLCV